MHFVVQKKSTTPRGRKKKIVEDEAVKEESTAEQEDVKTGEPANDAAEKPAIDTGDTAPHQEVAEEMASEETASAETKQEEPVPSQPDTSSSTEVPAAVESTLPAAKVAEAPAEAEQAEELETPTVMEQEQQEPSESTTTAPPAAAALE